jgi:hypothetical protein
MHAGTWVKLNAVEVVVLESPHGKMGVKAQRELNSYQRW